MNRDLQVQTLNTITGSYNKPVLLKPSEGIIKIELEIPEGELALKITGKKESF